MKYSLFLILLFSLNVNKYALANNSNFQNEQHERVIKKITAYDIDWEKLAMYTHGVDPQTHMPLSASQLRMRSEEIINELIESNRLDEYLLENQPKNSADPSSTIRSNIDVSKYEGYIDVYADLSEEELDRRLAVAKREKFLPIIIIASVLAILVVVLIVWYSKRKRFEEVEKENNKT
jgi:phosphate starvation-inducible membrane PsiE